MNWDTLFDMQQKLDDYISKNHQLDGENLLEERFLALLVETGELANETRCFKFWSKKEASTKEVILEEYVDNIHFLLSLGLHKGYTFSTLETTQKAEQKNMTITFNELFATCLQFYKEQTKEHYKAMFQMYIQLASMLGFSEQDIMEAYYEKNEVNFQRQDEGY